MSEVGGDIRFGDSQTILTGLEIKVIRKLHRRGKYGGSHTSLEGIARSFRSDLRGMAAEAIRGLIRRQIILSRPTHYGLEISLNQARIPLIHKVCEYYDANAEKVRNRESHVIE